MSSFPSTDDESESDKDAPLPLRAIPAVVTRSNYLGAKFDEKLEKFREIIEREAPNANWLSPHLIARLRRRAVTITSTNATITTNAQFGAILHRSLSLYICYRFKDQLTASVERKLRESGLDAIRERVVGIKLTNGILAAHVFCLNDVGTKVNLFRVPTGRMLVGFQDV